MIFFLLFFIPFVYTQVSYTIDWNLVDSDSSILNYQQDFGSCVCDLTKNSCDANCCCDKDCSEGQINYFKGGCLLESSTTSNLSEIPYCSDQLVKVNVRDGIMVSVTKQGIQQGICVYAENSPSKGSFYTNPGIFSTESAFESKYLLQDFTTSSNSITDVFLNTQSYQTGDAIKVGYTAAGLYGALGFPRKGDDGQCNIGTKAKFGINEDSECGFYFSTGAASCVQGSQVDVNYYTKGFNVYKQPTSSSTISITAGTNSCYNKDTGVTSNCALASPTWDNVNSVCNNGVYKISWKVSYSVSTEGDVTIDSIVADTILSSFKVSDYSSADLRFSISFVQTSQTDESIAKSGNAGYVIGKPVLAGKVTTNNAQSAIQQYTDARYGLSLAADFVAPGASRVTCSGKTDVSHRIPVLFGQEMHSYCTLYYNLADLTNNCATIRRDIYTIQTLTASSLTHVGKFGNTSFLNIDDWVSILNTVPSSLTGNTAILEPLAGTCSSILTEFNIQFLTANFGSTSNPQTGIVGARYSYVSGSISYRCLNSMDCIAPSDVITGGSNTPGASTQPFRIKSTVSFIPVADDPTLVVPTPPRLIPPLPNDIFYPFSL